MQVSFTLKDGEEFEGIYYNAGAETDEGKKLLTVGNGGLVAVANSVNTFVLKMLSGGGMMLGLKIGTKAVQLDPEEKPEEKPEVKPAEEKVESKQEAKTDEPKQEATQTVADTTSTIATIGTATVYNLLKIKDKSGKAELAFRNVGKYEIKSPDGNDEGSFGMEDGKIVLTSQTGKKMTIEDGILAYVVGDQTYEFKFGEADLEKLAAVK